MENYSCNRINDILQMEVLPLGDAEMASQDIRCKLCWEHWRKLRVRIEVRGLSEGLVVVCSHVHQCFPLFPETHLTLIHIWEGVCVTLLCDLFELSSISIFITALHLKCSFLLSVTVHPIMVVCFVYHKQLWTVKHMALKSYIKVSWNQILLYRWEQLSLQGGE